MDLHCRPARWLKPTKALFMALLRGDSSGRGTELLWKYKRFDTLGSIVLA